MVLRTQLGGKHGLVAIILITRSRPGPKLVFHYPAVPNIQSNGHQRQSVTKREFDDDSDSDFDADETNRSHQEEADRLQGVKHEKSSSADREQDATDHILGCSADTLEKLLSPGRWSDGKKFEICLDGLTFLSHPIYAGEDGTWSKDEDSKTHEPRRPHVKNTSTSPGDRRPSIADGEQLSTTTSSTSITITEPEAPAQSTLPDFRHIPESFTSLGTSMNSTSTASNDVSAEQMAMFNVVFVLSTKSHKDVRDLYQQIVIKFSTALHYCQSKSGYVATENRRLLAVKTKAKQETMTTEALWSSMVKSSELAWALKELYEKLSVDDVARIRLSGMEMSLQLSPPNPQDPTDRKEDALGPHSGLLFLEDRDALLLELSHPDASPLAHFIHDHLPTKSLQKNATKLGMSINDVLYLANHLIEWRKARVITPLHARNTYVVGPNAPIDQIAELVPEYARKFAALPPLPHMLKILSGKPIRYGLLIPSRDHRAPYMDILAYLVRHNFVTQMKTYGWLKSGGQHDLEDQWKPAETQTKPRPNSYQSIGVSLLSPHLRPVEDDNVSMSSERTAIPISAIQSIPEEHDEDHDGQHADAPTIILDPLDPTEEEMEYCKEIEASIGDSDFRDRFQQFMKYLDGEHAFEEIAAKEGLKRARVEEWLADLERRGHLLTYRSL